MAPSTALPKTVGIAASALRSASRGDVLVASDDDYDQARRIWNGAVDKSPALIARCAGERDVALAVCAAREHGLPLAVRGGGHDWGGRSVTDGGVMIDMTGMRGVIVDPATATARVQGGAHAGDVAAATDPYGLAPVTGTAKVVGITGLALAGGYGLLSGAHGLALDNLLSARVVLADGTAVTASATENPDLFWALRGGGGNFGVVVESVFRVHPLPRVVAGMVLFPLAQAGSVLRRLREVLAEAPDELTVMTGSLGAPDGGGQIYLLPAWIGDPARGDEITARITGLGRPDSVDVSVQSYQDVLGTFDPYVVDGQHHEMRTRWLPPLTDDAIDILVDAARNPASPSDGMVLHHFHGAATRVASDATAYAQRSEHMLVEILGTWDPAEAAEPHQRWARGLSASLAGFALPGGYPNLLGADEPDLVRIGYGANYDRLLRIKHTVDPDNVFRAVPTLLT